MAAIKSDNLIIYKAPFIGAFVLRRYDRGIREVHCTSTPVVLPCIIEARQAFGIQQYRASAFAGAFLLRPLTGPFSATPFPVPLLDIRGFFITHAC